MLDGLNDRDWKVVLACCAGLGRRGARRAADAVLPLLDHEYSGVREGACRTLLELGVRNPRIVEVLEELLSDPEVAAKERMGEEFERLLSEDLGEDPERVPTIRQLLEQAHQPAPGTD